MVNECVSGWTIVSSNQKSINEKRGVLEQEKREICKQRVKPENAASMERD
jgi:hypothetical protein